MAGDVIGKVAPGLVKQSNIAELGGWGGVPAIAFATKP